MFQNWNCLQQKAAQWISEYLPYSKKYFSLQHKLIHLRVAWNLCLVSVQQKPHIRLFVTFFPTRATDLVTSRCFRNELHLAVRYSFSQGEGERERATVVLPYHPPSSLSPTPPNKEEDRLIQAKWIYASQRLVKGTSNNWVRESCVPRF